MSSSMTGLRQRRWNEMKSHYIVRILSIEASLYFFVHLRTMDDNLTNASTITNKRLSAFEERLSNVERMFRYAFLQYSSNNTIASHPPLPCADIPSSYSEMTTEMFVVNEYHRRKYTSPYDLLSLAKAVSFLSEHTHMVKHGVLYWTDSDFGESKLVRNSDPIDME